MRYNYKRFLSLLMAIAIILAMLPTSVWAEDSTCSHNKWTSHWDYDQSVTYTPTNEGYHTTKGYKYDLCGYCSERFNTYSAEEWESHQMNGTGVCSLCGYVCTHSTTRDEYSRCTYTSIDSSYHLVTEYYNTVCTNPVCFMVILIEDPNHTKTKKEWHNEHYITGECLICGYNPSHTHNYQTSSTETTIVNAGADYHNVVTTTYTKCSCGSTGEPTVTTVQEAHTFNPAGYQAAHPHSQYAVCSCGAETFVEGSHQTANGVVQDVARCCICNGHKLGEVQETAPGVWVKICTNCGISQAAEAPDQSGAGSPETTPTETVPPETTPDEEHIHDAKIGFEYEVEHPHLATGRCSVCGIVVNRYVYLEDCCQCTGDHNWGDAIRLPDGTYRVVCNRCNATQEVTPSDDVLLYYKIVDIITYRHNAAKSYQKARDIDSSATSIWKTIAGQATDKLLNVDFVTATETLNTFSDINGSLIGVFTEESWDQQQIDFWKKLLLQMLQDQDEVDIDEAGENAAGILTSVLKAIKNISAENYEMLMEKADILHSDIVKLRNTTPNSDLYKESKLYQRLYQERTDTLNTATDQKYNEYLFEDITLFMESVSIVAEGNDKRKEADKYNQLLADLAKNNENLKILGSIAATADATGNLNLANAAYELRDELADEMVQATNMLLSEAGAFFQGCAEGGLDFAVGKLLDALTGSYSGALDSLELSAKVLSAILDWNDAYDAAQVLMTLNQMDIAMNITNVLKDEDCPEMAELWGYLQTAGCDQAQLFLKEWEDGTGLSVKDFNIKKNGLNAVLNQLKFEQKYYNTALGLTENDSAEDVN